MKTTVHIKIGLLICLLLQLAGLGSVFGQPAEQTLTEAIQSFEQSTGEERASRIATYIRFAHLHDMDWPQLEPYLKEADTWEVAHPDPDLRNTLRLAHANIYIAKDTHLLAIHELQAILHSAAPVSGKDSVSVYNFLAALFEASHLYEEAWKMLMLREQCLDNQPASDPFIARFLTDRNTDFGILYLRMEEYEKAIASLRKTAQIARDQQDLHRESGAYNNLGYAFYKMGKCDSAIFHYRQAAHKWKELMQLNPSATRQDSVYLALLDGNIAGCYNLLHRYEEAIPLLKEDIRLARLNGDFTYQINSYADLSMSYLGMNKVEAATSALDSADAILIRHFTPGGYVKMAQSWIKLYETTGQLDQAYLLHKDLVHFNDSLDQVQKEGKVAIMEVVYEAEQKEREIERQKQVITETTAIAERQRSQKRLYIIGVIALVLIVIIAIRSAIQRSRRATTMAHKNQKIEEQNEIIERSLAEKETLLKEIHHRVKNNLQLIAGIFELQAIKYNDQAIREVMEQGQSRVRSMSLIHEQLYQSGDLGRIKFEGYLDKLVHDISIAFRKEQHQIAIQVDTHNLSFDVNVAIPLALIINELVTNAYKHGFAEQTQGNIWITLQNTRDHHYELRVRDDGKGLPVDFDPSQSTSLGLRLVHGLSQQLGGSYRFENGNGTTFIIDFTTEFN